MLIIGCAEGNICVESFRDLISADRNLSKCGNWWRRSTGRLAWVCPPRFKERTRLLVDLHCALLTCDPAWMVGEECAEFRVVSHRVPHPALKCSRKVGMESCFGHHQQA